jgi:hypothetical protein
MVSSVAQQIHVTTWQNAHRDSNALKQQARLRHVVLASIVNKQIRCHDSQRQAVFSGESTR